MKVTTISIIVITALLGAYTVFKQGNKQETTSQNDIAATMLAKFKKAFPSYDQTRYNNAADIINYSVKLTQDTNQIAYILATAVGESGVMPIKEKRAAPGTPLRKIQDQYWYTGFMGRGYVQLTWESNYKKFADVLHVDLVGNPDLALNPVYAAEILGMGMKKAMFTGVGLDNYINSQKVDFYNARRIINGLDAAQTFADYAERIVKA